MNEQNLKLNHSPDEVGKTYGLLKVKERAITTGGAVLDGYVSVNAVKK